MRNNHEEHFGEIFKFYFFASYLNFLIETTLYLIEKVEIWIMLWWLPYRWNKMSYGSIKSLKVSGQYLQVLKYTQLSKSEWKIHTLRYYFFISTSFGNIFPSISISTVILYFVCSKPNKIFCETDLDRF